LVLKTTYAGGDVTVTVHPVEVVEDHAVVTLDFVLEPGGESFSLGQALKGSIEERGAGGVRLVDLVGDRVWTAGYDSAGVSAATKLRNLKPGEPLTTVTMFAVPGSANVYVFVPGVGLVPDVPVVEGGSDVPSVQSLGLSGKVTFPDPWPLRTYTQSYVDGVSVSGQGADQTVTLASDVLFDTDKFDLTAGAAQVVAEAGTAIKGAASGGEVRVVGHTDDVSSAEYNMELSVKRAQTVATALAADLGGSFAIVSEGKGKTQPAVPGTSAEARAANRRVEIRFTAERRVGFDSSVVPAAEVPVSSGHESVEYLKRHYWGEGDITVQASVVRVVRRDGYLVGTINVSLVKDNDAGSVDFWGMMEWFGDVSKPRNLSDLEKFHGSWPVYLLTDAGKVYAAQYSVGAGKSEAVWFLAESQSTTEPNMPVGRVYTFDVVWPDLGADTISVEAAEHFRIVDIPVEDG